MLSVDHPRLTDNMHQLSIDLWMSIFLVAVLSCMSVCLVFCLFVCNFRTVACVYIEPGIIAVVLVAAIPVSLSANVVVLVTLYTCLYQLPFIDPSPSVEQ